MIYSAYRAWGDDVSAVALAAKAVYCMFVALYTPDCFCLIETMCKAQTVHSNCIIISTLNSLYSLYRALTLWRPYLP